MSLSFRKIRIWLIGFIISGLFIWVVSAVFVNSLSSFVWDDVLEKYVYAPGSVIKWRSEGWADTRIGEHRFLKGEDRIAMSEAPKFIYWGDSQVEALQLSNGRKAMGQFNAISKGKPYYGLTVGAGGRRVADYYFGIPVYERSFPNIMGHVVLLSGLDDVMPGRRKDHAYYQCDPWRLEPGHAAPPNRMALTYAPFVSAMQLGGFYDVYKSLMGYRFVFAPGQQEAKAGVDTGPAPEKRCGEEDGWRYLLGELLRETDGFLVFVYCPYTPKLEQGAVSLKNPEEDAKELFARVCSEMGVGFVDLSRTFNEFYRETGRLPRGFFNSPPGAGHLNADGQRLIAEALHEYFTEGNQ